MADPNAPPAAANSGRAVRLLRRYWLRLTLACLLLVAILTAVLYALHLRTERAKLHTWTLVIRPASGPERRIPINLEYSDAELRPLLETEFVRMLAHPAPDGTCGDYQAEYKGAYDDPHLRDQLTKLTNGKSLRADLTLSVESTTGKIPVWTDLTNPSRCGRVLQFDRGPQLDVHDRKFAPGSWALELLSQVRNLHTAELRARTR